MKTKLVDFDIAKAKAGAKVFSEDGKSVKILCYDRKSKDDKFPIIGLVDLGSHESVQYFSENGKGDFGAIDRLCIEEEVEETQRMTNYELARWLTEGNGHYRQVLTDSHTVVNHYAYDEGDDDFEVSENTFVRENKGDWQEPLVTLLGEGGWYIGS